MCSRILKRRAAATQVAWMNGLMDFVFPYLIQFLREYTGKVDTLYMERKERQTAAVDEESAKKQQEAQSNAYLQLMPLALPAPPVAGAQAGSQTFGGGAFGGGAAPFGGGAPGGFGQPPADFGAAQF
jgi:clathrin heavy chain